MGSVRNAGRPSRVNSKVNKNKNILTIADKIPDFVTCLYHHILLKEKVYISAFTDKDFFT